MGKQTGNKDTVTDESRRGFLKLASVSAPAAVATVALTGTTAGAAEMEQGGNGLRDTAHTRAYFDSARF
jgi:hypothetical protein